MRLAFCLRKDEPKAAKSHLEKARKIVKDDKKLVIRRRQVEDLARMIEN